MKTFLSVNENIVVLLCIFKHLSIFDTVLYFSETLELLAERSLNSGVWISVSFWLSVLVTPSLLCSI